MKGANPLAVEAGCRHLYPLRAIVVLYLVIIIRV
jgi:hypothetical protein